MSTPEKDHFSLGLERSLQDYQAEVWFGFNQSGHVSLILSSAYYIHFLEQQLDKSIVFSRGTRLLCLFLEVNHFEFFCTLLLSHGELLKQ